MFEISMSMEILKSQFCGNIDRNFEKITKIDGNCYN